MPFQGSNRVVVIVGEKGSGKSTYAEEQFLNSRRAIVVDSQWEYMRGFCVQSKLHLVQYLKNNERFRIVYRPLDDDGIDYVCKVAMAKRRLLLIVEEMGQYCSPNSISKPIKHVFARGRHSELDVIVTAHRFADLPRLITFNADEYILFRANETIDLEGLEKRFGERVADKVSNLGDLEYLRIDRKKWRADNGTLDLGSCGGHRGMVHRNVPAANLSGDSATNDWEHRSEHGA